MKRYMVRCELWDTCDTIDVDVKGKLDGKDLLDFAVKTLEQISGRCIVDMNCLHSHVYSVADEDGYFGSVRFIELGVY